MNECKNTDIVIILNAKAGSDYKDFKDNGYRNRIVPRANHITAEILKADHDQTSQKRKQAFDQMWKEEKMSKKGTNKGNLQDCSNMKVSLFLI